MFRTTSPRRGSSTAAFTNPLDPIDKVEFHAQVLGFCCVIQRYPTCYPLKHCSKKTVATFDQLFTMFWHRERSNPKYAISKFESWSPDVASNLKFSPAEAPHRCCHRWSGCHGHHRVRNGRLVVASDLLGCKIQMSRVTISEHLVALCTLW